MTDGARYEGRPYNGIPAGELAGLDWRPTTPDGTGVELAKLPDGGIASPLCLVTQEHYPQPIVALVRFSAQSSGREGEERGTRCPPPHGTGGG